MNQNNDLPEGFKMTELGPLPKEWDVVRLGEILEEVEERARDVDPLGAQNFPILSLTKNDGLILQLDRFGKRIATENVSNYKVVRRGQIVYNPYVIWEGAIHILQKFDAGLVSPVYPVLSAKRNFADPYFLDAWLRTPQAIAAYNRFAAGAVNRRRAIKKRDFWNIKIPFPPLPEQKKIAAVLSSVQEAREKTEAVIRALKELKKSMMKHLFTYGPVPQNDADSVPLKETEIGMVSEEWEVVRLGDVVNLIMGQSPPGSTYNIKGNGVPFLQGKAEFGEIHPRHVKFTTDPKKIAPKDSILMSVRAPVGDVNIADIDYCIGRGLSSISLMNGDNKYLFYTLTLLKPSIEKEGTGSTFKAINKSKLENIKIPLPPLSEQKKIAAVLSAIDDKIQAEENKKKSLDDLFKTLLNDLMTAKIRVNHLNLGVE
ncbi:MAG: restriction endonuclease subunit S [Candidatus Parvarchaeota archaeon]